MVEWFLMLPLGGQLVVAYVVLCLVCLCLFVPMMWNAPRIDEDSAYAKLAAENNCEPPKPATSEPRGASINSTKKTPASAV